MDIKQWFDKAGTYKEGVALYSKLPGRNLALFRSLAKENSANFLKLKYELKKALLAGSQAKPPENVITPAPPKEPAPDALRKQIVAQAAAASFEKETMAMYPVELHPVYRQRITDFYLACELKFKLNATPDRDDRAALEIILQLEDLWGKIDQAWTILNHWKDHNRLMPVKESEDFSKLNGIQLLLQRGRLETRISKRQATVDKKTLEAQASPEDRTLQNGLFRKVEQLQQLKIDLETIRNLINNESRNIGST